MQLDLSASEGEGLRQRLMDAIPPSWRAPIAWLAVAWLVQFVVFLPEWAAMAHQWWDSSTYNHVLLIPPILAWLVAQRWGELRKLVPQTWWPALIPFAGAAFLWVLGGFAGFGLVQQAAAVFMLQASLAALLGPRVVAGLLFPLFYLVFLVPFGDEMIPALQMVTARIALWLLHLTGVRASLEGVFITAPRGYFEVAEACSGVKFLVAMVAYGVLAANVCFRSRWRRTALLAACLVVPILANGARAWGTIFIAQHVGIAFAQGFDHVFYGWVFFAIVMALVMAMGWRFFDRPANAPMIDADAIEGNPFLARLCTMRIGPSPLLVSLAMTVGVAIGWAAMADRLAAPLPSQVYLPDVPGWHRIDYTPAHAWQPLHGGAEHRLLGRYADGNGHTVDVSFALFSRQGDGAEAGGFGQGAQPSGSDWAWVSPAPSLAGGSGARIQAPGGFERTAITWYHTGHLTTGSNLALKLANIADRLLLRERTTSALILSAEERPGASSEDALARFLSATGDPGAWMDRVSKGG